MKCTKRELNQLYEACVRAIEWNESLIDSCKTEFTGVHPYNKIIPEEFLPQTNKWQKEMLNWNRLRLKIIVELTENFK